MIGTLTPALQQVQEDETQQRLRWYDKAGLPTDRSSGPYTREEVHGAGVGLEIVFRAFAFNDPPVAAWGTGLDGGTDYVIPDGRSVNVMCAMRPGPNWCYNPRFKPIKAALICQGCKINNTTFQLLGIISSKRYFELCRPTLIGRATYPAIPISEMLPFDEWLASLNIPEPF